jgi:hypothetical protein
MDRVKDLEPGRLAEALRERRTLRAGIQKSPQLCDEPRQACRTHRSGHIEQEVREHNGGPRSAVPRL